MHKYLYYTQIKVLIYRLKYDALIIIAYTDAAHHVNALSHGHTGYCLFIEDANSGAIVAVSKVQTMVSLSTTESETIAAVEATKEIIWYRNTTLKRSVMLKILPQNYMVIMRR